MDIVNEKDVEKRPIGIRTLQWMISDDGAIQSDLCSCCIVEMQPGCTAKPPHSHTNEEEAIYIIEGCGVMMAAGGVKHVVEQGSFILARRNEIHMLCNESDRPMKAICFYSDKTDVSKYTLYPMSAVGMED